MDHIPFYIMISFTMMLMAFMLNTSHLLMSLLYLEGMMLSMVLLISMTMSPSPIHQLSLMLLTFSACEASLGLSMIVKMSRSHGSDLLSSTALNSC